MQPAQNRIVPYNNQEQNVVEYHYFKEYPWEKDKLDTRKMLQNIRATQNQVIRPKRVNETNTTTTNKKHFSDN